MLALLLLALPLLPPQAPTARELPSRIDRVTVYDGQALVERVFEVEAAAAGPLAVMLAPLPAAADSSTFQARLETGPAKVQGLQMRSRSGEPAGSERDRLAGRVAELRDALRGLETDAAEIAAGAELVRAATEAVKKGAGSPDPAGLSQLFEFVSGKSGELDRRRIALERQQWAIRAEIDDLERLLGGKESARRPFQEARVSLFFERPGRAVLRLIYLVPGASWRPLYDVRLDPDLSRIEVGLSGELRQQSGEDWEDAALVLSTARPRVGLDPPELPRLWASVWDPQLRRRGLVGEGLGYTDAAAASVDAPGEDLGMLGYAGEAEPAPAATLQDYGLTQQWSLPERVTVPADGEPKTWPLVQVPLEMRPERYVVPSSSLEAYLRAEVTSAAAAPLLPGEARIFLGPDFLGRASFPLLRQGDSTMLNLGLDPNLTVELVQVRDEREEPGVFSDTVHLHRAWQLDLKLGAAAAGPASILIEEAFPVSRDDRIEIQPIAAKPAALAGEQDLADRQERGIWRWRVELAPGASQTLRWGWSAAFDEELAPEFGAD